MKYEETLNKISENKQNKKTILLHICCAPCSTYVLDYLNDHFEITLFFYNPNIDTKKEFDRRLDETKNLLKQLDYKVNLIEKEYNKKEFDKALIGAEHTKEGGLRCFKCYELRLNETAINAKTFDYFSTTLSVSPHKNSEWLNYIGENLEYFSEAKFLTSNFKKNDGYKKSIELSKKYNLYRQDYCGCIYSKQEKEERTKLKEFNN